MPLGESIVTIVTATHVQVCRLRDCRHENCTSIPKLFDIRAFLPDYDEVILTIEH